MFKRAFSAAILPASKPAKTPYVKYGLAALGFGAATVLAVSTETRKYVSRPAIFWSNMFPIYLHYRYTKTQVKSLPEEEQEARYEVLHKEYGPKILAVILRLKGFFIKAGQVAVTRPDLFPETLGKELKVLLDSVPSLPGNVARQIVNEAMGGKMDDFLSDFNEEAIGAASIGQVHSAIWKATGQKVAVKVRYPDSRELFLIDIRNMRAFATLAQPEQLPVFDEMERQFLKEFDFDKEGEALIRIGANIHPVYGNQVRIPQPLFYNENIVVMEFLEGVKLIDAVMDNYRDMADSMGITLDELIKKNKNPPKPTIIGAMITPLYMMFLNMRGLITASWNGLSYGVSWLFGWPLVEDEKKAKMRYRGKIDAKSLLKTLVEVHGHEILIDGAFNGDPHPGNILLMDNGKLGLIDYGQVKYIEERDRYLLARIIVALTEDSRDEIAKIIFSMGYDTKHRDPAVAHAYAKILFDREDPDYMQGMPFQEYLEDLDRRDRVIKNPDQYIMAGRVSILLHGLEKLFGVRPENSISIAHAWKPLAQRAIKDYEKKHGREVIPDLK